MSTALDLTFAQGPEPAFDLIKPQRRGRGEVDLEAGMAGLPRAHCWCLMCAVVVHDEMDIKSARNIGFDGSQELQELLAAMATMGFTDYLAGSDVECGEQGRGAMAHIVMRASFGNARSQRQDRLRTIQCLNLTLLIDTQHIALRGGSR